MRLIRASRTAVAMACALTLGAAPLLVTTSVTAKTAEGAEAAIHHITIKVAKRAITVRGAKGIPAGRIHVEVKGAGAAEILMFDRGYDERDLAKDFGAFERRGDIKALRRALAHTDFIGGFEAGGSGTVVLPKAGDYAIFSFASRNFGHFRAGAVKKAPAPDTDGRIIARSGPKWTGSSTMPAKGTFLFKNADRTVPHFVLLWHVAEGTTTDQVLEFASSEEGPPPEWFLPEGLETASINPGRSMTVDYDLPPGQYAIVCFFPDPNMGGMPHALMGMIRMIHLT